MTIHSNIRRISHDDYATCAEFRDRLKAIRDEAFNTRSATEQGDNALDWLHRGLHDVLSDLDAHMDDIPQPGTDAADPYRLADQHAYQRRA